MAIMLLNAAEILINVKEKFKAMIMLAVMAQYRIYVQGKTIKWKPQCGN